MGFRIKLLGFLVSLLLTISLCQGKNVTVEVIGLLHCTDCIRHEFTSSQEYSGINVSIQCKSWNREAKTQGNDAIDKEGRFTVKLSPETTKVDSNYTCFAELQSESTSACPIRSSQTASLKILSKEENNYTQTRPPTLIKFSPVTCQSAFFWPKHNFSFFDFFPPPPLEQPPPSISPPAPPVQPPLPPAENSTPPPSPPSLPPPSPEFPSPSPFCGPNLRAPAPAPAPGATFQSQPNPTIKTPSPSPSPIYKSPPFAPPVQPPLPPVENLTPPPAPLQPTLPPQSPPSLPPTLPPPSPEFRAPTPTPGPAFQSPSPPYNAPLKEPIPPPTTKLPTPSPPPFSRQISPPPTAFHRTPSVPPAPFLPHTPPLNRNPNYKTPPTPQGVTVLPTPPNQRRPNFIPRAPPVPVLPPIPTVPRKYFNPPNSKSQPPRSSPHSRP